MHEPSRSDRITTWIFPALTAIPCIFVAASVVAQVFAMLGIPWSSPLSALSIAAGLIVNRMIFFERAAFDQRLGLALLRDACGIFVLGALLSWVANAIYDLTWDGRSYHLEAILALGDGWSILQPDTGNRYADHYPRGAWIATHLVETLTGHLEFAKIWGLALGLTAFHWTTRSLAMLGIHGRALRTSCALLITLNPVWLMEAFTHLVDGVLAAWLLLLANAIFAATLRPTRAALGMIVIATSGLISTKFTGLPYAIVMLGGWFVWTALRAQLGLRDRSGLRLVALTSALALGLAIFVTSFSPYVTNTARYANPFYPAMQSATQHVLREEASLDFLSRNRLSKFFVSAFGKSANERGGAPRLKLPGTFDRKEVSTFSVEDVRFGGWGPLYSLALLGSFFLAIPLLMNPTNRLPFGFACGVLLSAIFVVPEPWWAKIVPHAYWLPWLPVLVGFAAGQPRVRVGAAFVMFILTLNVALVGARQLSWNYGATLEVKSQLAWLARESADGEAQKVRIRLFGPSTSRRLADAGVLFDNVDPLPCRIRMHEPTGVLSFCVTLIGAEEINSQTSSKLKNWLGAEGS